MFYDKKILDELKKLNKNIDRVLVLLKSKKIKTRRDDV